MATGNTKIQGSGLSADCEIGGLLKVKDSATMVGIGTMSPAALLHASVTGGSSTAGIFESDQSDCYITFKASGTSANTTVRAGTTGNNFNIFANGATRLYIKDNGNVGIGTTTPSHKLQVLLDNNSALKVGGNGSHVDGYHLELGQLGTNTSAGIKYTGSGGSMMFHNSSGEVARFRPDGELLLNQGVKHGTNSRSSWYSWLHVKGNTHSDAGDGRITLTSGHSLSANAAVGSVFFADLNGGDRAAIRCYQAAAGNSTDNFPGYLSFEVNNGSSSATERMRIDSVGRVGLNSGNKDLATFQANGSQDLVIYAKGTTGLNMHAGITLKAGSTSGQCSVTFADGDAADASRYAGSIDYFHSNDSMGFRTGSTGSQMLIDSGGNVGIGTTNTTAGKLSVNGNVSIATGSVIKSTSSAGGITIQGGATYPGGTIALSGGQNTNDIRFYNTGANTALVEEARINQYGLCFHGDSASQNALDDYEEGTFTPAINSGAWSGISFGVGPHGRYTKIGNVVHVVITMQFSSTGYSSNTRPKITNLPFTASNNQSSNYGGTLNFGFGTLELSTQTGITWYIPPGQSHATLYATNGTTYNTYPSANASNDWIQVSGCYTAA